MINLYISETQSRHPFSLTQAHKRSMHTQMQHLQDKPLNITASCKAVTQQFFNKKHKIMPEGLLWNPMKVGRWAGGGGRG